MTRHETLVLAGVGLMVAGSLVLHTAYASRPMPLMIRLLGLVV